MCFSRNRRGSEKSAVLWTESTVRAGAHSWGELVARVPILIRPCTGYVPLESAPVCSTDPEGGGVLAPRSMAGGTAQNAPPIQVSFVVRELS